MSNILSFFLSFLLLYKYFAIFVVIFLAAVIVPVPVNSLLLAAGAFSSQGYFSFATSLLVAVGANILGDSFDFFLAKKYGRRALQMLHVKTPSYLERLENFVGKHTGPAIFLTRFVGTIEPLTSLLCGFIGVKFKKFIIYDILGNIVSIGGVLYIGYYLGGNWQAFNGLFSITGYTLVTVALIIGLSIGVWYKSRG